MKKEALEDRLGAVLGRFGCRLGALKTPQTLRPPMFRENSRFGKNRCQEATWAEVGSIWLAKRLQKDGQDGAQKD